MITFFSIALMLPLLFGQFWGGISHWLFYFGGILFLRDNNTIFKKIRLWGFTLGEHLVVIASFLFPLMALAVVTAIWGEGSFLIWLWSLIGISCFLYLSYPPAHVLKKMHSAFICQDTPHVIIPYLILGVPQDNKPKVSLTFISMLNFRVLREGIRYFGIRERVRNLKNMESMNVTLSSSFMNDPRIRTFSEKTDELIKEKKNRSFWYCASLMREYFFSHFFGALLDHTLAIKVNYVIVTSSQLMNKSLEFSRYCEQFAAGSITITGDNPSAIEQFNTLKAIYYGADDLKEIEKMACERGLTDTQLESRDPRLWARLGVTDHPWAHSIPGPWYILLRTSTGVPDTLSGYVPVSVLGMRTWRSSIQRVNDLVSQQAIPTANSMANAEGKLKKIPYLIAHKGLAPIADAYMRFRHSTSAVERFLNLFDCFEVLIKFSYFTFISITGRIKAFSGSIPEQLKRPTLGHWVVLLQHELKLYDSNSTKGIINDFLINYWNSFLGDAPKSFIEAANGVGLAEQIEVPRTHLNWLSWLVALRNKTKGHGGTTESMALPLWHGFHVAFLDMVEGLKAIVLESELFTAENDGSHTVMNGWIRGPFRSFPPPRDTTSEQLLLRWAKLSFQNSIYDLTPFVCFENHQCLTWNGSPKSRIAEYTEYSTGRISRVNLVDLGVIDSL